MAVFCTRPSDKHPHLAAAPRRNVRGQRPFHDEPRAAIVRRRIVTIPRAILMFVAVTVLLPFLLAGAVVVDAVRSLSRRRPWMAVRMVAFAWIFLAAEQIGLSRFFVSWITSGFGLNRRRLVATAWPVQHWWARTLLGWVQRLFDLDLEVEGHELVTPGPILAMFRHASIVDNLLPAVLIGDRHKFELRWIIKRELLNVPALDVGGTRLPNHFVERAADDPRAEIRSIRRLAEGLGPGQGVMIFPEGTRFTPERRKRAIASLEERYPELADRARRLTNLLPPRVGGPLTLLDTGYDVVLCAHEGLDGFARVSDIWSGAMVGRTVKVRFWRVPADTIPTDRRQRVSWLFDQWEMLDAWIGAARAGA
jgi:1-acyl-sn-glycerol-3-phosphate acyltransferase